MRAITPLPKPRDSRRFHLQLPESHLFLRQLGRGTPQIQQSQVQGPAKWSVSACFSPCGSAMFLPQKYTLNNNHNPFLRHPSSHLAPSLVFFVAFSWSAGHQSLCGRLHHFHGTQGSSPLRSAAQEPLVLGSRKGLERPPVLLILSLWLLLVMRMRMREEENDGG